MALKKGADRSGSNTPMAWLRCDLRFRAKGFARNSSSAMASRMAMTFFSRTLPPFMYLDTVEGATPALAATSLIVEMLDIFPPKKRNVTLFCDSESTKTTVLINYNKVFNRLRQQ